MAACDSASHNALETDLLSPANDLSSPGDLGVPDLREPDDLSLAPDLSIASDLSGGEDLSLGPDFAISADMTTEDMLPAAPTGTWVDAVNGSDTTGNGTLAKPFQHLHKAATVAVSGQTIWALPGNYGFDTAQVQLADGVGLQAVTPGTVSVLSPNSVTFSGSGFARDVIFNQVQVNVSAGTVDIDGCQFMRAENGSGACGIYVNGTGKVVVTPNGLGNYLGDNASVNFARVEGSGQLEIHGGTFLDTGNSPYSRDYLLLAANNGSLLLDGVTLSRCRVNGIEMFDDSHVTVQNHTVFSDCAQNQSSSVDTAIMVSGASAGEPSPSPTLIFDNSTITWASPSPLPVAGAVGIYVAQNTQFPNVTVRNSSVIEFNQSDGIAMYSTGGKLTLASSQIRNNGGRGVIMSSSTSQVLDSSGMVITGNAGSGMALSGIFQAKVRNTQITNNTNGGFDGSYIDPSSTIDIGKIGDNGGNTFAGNAAATTSYANVMFNANPGPATYYAIGNTWSPNTQGSDASGHFTASNQTFTATPGVPVLPSANGGNVILFDYGTSTSLKLIVNGP